MSRITQKELKKLHDLVSSHEVPEGNWNKAKQWRSTVFWMGVSIKHQGKLSLAINEFGKSTKQTVRRIAKLPLDQMPLYINHPKDGVRIFAKWRLEIGR